MAKTAKQVTIYSQPGWLFCGKVKELLSQRDVAYTDRDVSTDEAALNELAELGFLTTPVVKIDGEVVVGFDRQKLEALLA